MFSYRQLVGGHGSRYPHKECVTTHQPNENVSKMDGAKDNQLILKKVKDNVIIYFYFCRRIWRLIIIQKFIFDNNFNV